VQRLARFGVRVLPTAEVDIAAALSLLAAGEPLPAPLPHTH